MILADIQKSQEYLGQFGACLSWIAHNIRSPRNCVRLKTLCRNGRNLTLEDSGVFLLKMNLVMLFRWYGCDNDNFIFQRSFGRYTFVVNIWEEHRDRAQINPSLKQMVNKNPCIHLYTFQIELDMNWVPQDKDCAVTRWVFIGGFSTQKQNRWILKRKDPAVFRVNIWNL